MFGIFEMCKVIIIMITIIIIVIMIPCLQVAYSSYRL